MTNKIDCAFCTVPDEWLVVANDIGIVIRDNFPISQGHTLVIPRRHVQSFFDLQRLEQDGLLDLLAVAHKDLERQFAPSGYNIGINDGVAAGQTVMHLHIHLIPRYCGDSPDPRGGVRWILPDKARYWSR